MRSRDEHLAWARKRALEYVDTGQLHLALVSLSSDLTKHEDTSADQEARARVLDATRRLAEGRMDAAALRAWIECFR